jgi:hypothetical protein
MLMHCAPRPWYPPSLRGSNRQIIRFHRIRILMLSLGRFLSSSESIVQCSAVQWRHPVGRAGASVSLCSPGTRTPVGHLRRLLPPVRWGPPTLDTLRWDAGLRIPSVCRLLPRPHAGYCRCLMGYLLFRVYFRLPLGIPRATMKLYLN